MFMQRPARHVLISCTIKAAMLASSCAYSVMCCMTSQRRYAMQRASAAAADDDNASAAQELDRVFNQADFPRMRIIGQFNLGFIVVRLGQDLFIVDQHASDEKFNFERLASTTVLNKQPLLRRQTLDLSPGEGVTVRENLAVFVKNGFDIQEQANGQLALAAVPFSKNITFGRDDVLELVGMLSGHGDHQGAMSLSAFPSAATLHRPSRYDTMYAFTLKRSSAAVLLVFCSMLQNGCQSV